MKNRMYTISGLVIAILYWLLDTSIHYFVYGEPQFKLIPNDVDELWMRVVIASLLLLFGIGADYSAKRLLIKEKQLEAAHVYKSMIYASHHILNNLLNQMQAVKYEAVRCDEFDREVIKSYDDAFDEAKRLIQKLSEVENITDENIWASVDPNNISNTVNNINQEAH